MEILVKNYYNMLNISIIDIILYLLQYITNYQTSVMIFKFISIDYYIYENINEFE